MSKILIEIPDNIDYKNYDMPYFVLDAITKGKLIPDNATNGDMIKVMLQVVGYTPLSIWSEEKRKKSGFHVHIKNEHKCDFSLTVSEDWWNAPYKTESEE